MYKVKDGLLLEDIFPAIHFFFRTVIVSQEHLNVKDTVFILQHLLQASIVSSLVVSRKFEVYSAYLRKVIVALLL